MTAGTVVFSPFLAWWGTWAVTAARSLVAGPPVPGTPRPLTFDVVVPAHNEERSIATVVGSLLDQRGPARIGRLLVVADHCSDRTGDVARAAGAEVLTRDAGPAGKPPAVREGAELLAAADDRGDVLVMVDADCLCDGDFLNGLSARFFDDVQVVQAAYVLAEGDRGAVRSSLRRGFALRNTIRARGADLLGLPVELFGSGIALRWDVLQLLSFGDPRRLTGDSRPGTDDVLMSLELLEAGVRVRFAASAGLAAAVAEADAELGAQRLRWEGAQVILWRRAARAASVVARRGDWRAVLSLTDWMAPPLVPTVGVYTGLTAVVAAAVAARRLPAAALLPPVAAAALLAGYLACGLSALDGPAAVWDVARGAPRFVAWKAGLYARRRGT